MRTIEQRAPHPRAGVRRRVVKRSNTDAITRLVESKQLAAIHYGRQAAALIRQRFPDFYAAHVADLSCDDLAEMNGSGINWCSDALIAIAADQTAARGWFEHYHALNTLVAAELTILSARVSKTSAYDRSIRCRHRLRYRCNAPQARMQPRRNGNDAQQQGGEKIRQRLMHLI